MSNSAFSQNPFGKNATVVDETPGGSINSSNTAFTTANNYVGGTLAVYLNGVRQEEGAGNDFTEGGTNTFTMLTAPETGDKIIVDYVQSVTERGNAATLGGKTAADLTLDVDSDFVITDEGTTSTSYTALATAQSVTVSVKESGVVLVNFSMGVYGTTTGVKRASVAVSGASTVAADDDWAIRQQNSSFEATQSGHHLFTGLTPGETTFTLQFKTSSGTGQFFQRELTAVAL